VEQWTLDQCIHLALERQPALAAQRASLAAAVDGQQALAHLHIPTLIARDLPIRRHQAALGVQAASAGLQQAEYDTVYAVTRNYFSVVYARAQVQVAQKTVERLKALEDFVAKQLKTGERRDVTQDQADRLTVYLRSAETKQVQATEGVNRALAAVREAIGLGPNCDFHVVGDQLPQPAVHVAKQDIVALALSRRGELIQAGTLADVTCLEVDAQGKSCRPRMSTFASASDIHAREIPPGISNDEYRPGGIPPEMPGTLVGSRSARVERAQAFSTRANAVVDKTRNLIALEAENAFLRWQETLQQVGPARQAADAAERLAESLQKQYLSDPRSNVKFDEILAARVLAGQVQAQVNEVLYHHLLALAALERITTGGFCAGFTQAAMK
jgi:outer membrane protein TolC